MHDSSRKISRIRSALAGIGGILAEHARAMQSAAAAMLPRRRVRNLSLTRAASTIQGQLLRLSERREAAIYLRGGTLWVADFIDGWGELVDAATWFRFNCAVPGASSAQRRMLLESALPLSSELAARIEALHRLDTEPPRAVAREPGPPRATARDSPPEVSHEPIF